MIEDTLKQIEARIGGAESVSEERRRELLQLVATLKTEVAELSQSHGEQAQSIAGFAQVSAHEATREQQNPQLLRLSLQGLTQSVEGFEQSHPALARVVNNISQTLANLGI
jgi:prefoldin subunit 5